MKLSATSHVARNSGEFSRNSSNDCIPLIIKQYENGSFTSKYLQAELKKKLILSESRGFGLSLNNNNPGRIVIIGGGTGLNPYYDLIDLLFKDLLIKSNHKFSSTLKNN